MSAVPKIHGDLLARFQKRSTVGKRSVTVRLPVRILLHLEASSTSLQYLMEHLLIETLEKAGIDLSVPHPYELELPEPMPSEYDPYETEQP